MSSGNGFKHILLFNCVKAITSHVHFIRRLFLIGNLLHIGKSIVGASTFACQHQRKLLQPVARVVIVCISVIVIQNQLIPLDCPERTNDFVHLPDYLHPIGIGAIHSCHKHSLLRFYVYIISNFVVLCQVGK